MTGLSCFTANLHAYLTHEWDSDALVADSVRLAIRPRPSGLLAFSHHEPSLDRLPDRSVLTYAGATTAAAALLEMELELATYGRVLAVVDATRLPWSVARGGEPTPHWLCIDRRLQDRWHVVDQFTCLLPEGKQEKFDGWLTTSELREVMTPSDDWAADHAVRLRHAFGAAVALPSSAVLWLRRRNRADHPTPKLLGDWLVGDQLVLPFIRDQLTAEPERIARNLSDLWAAAGHRCFAYRWRLDTGRRPVANREALETALSRWERLPQLLQMIVSSAKRGRARPALATKALDAVTAAEDSLR